MNYRSLCETANSEPLIINKENSLIRQHSSRAHSSEKPNASRSLGFFFSWGRRTDYPSRFPGLNSRGCAFMIGGRPFYADLRLAMTGVWVIFLFWILKRWERPYKNPLLGLRQPWGLRCGLYKQFNIWSMADLCTLPWLFVPTGPCRDCLPTLPHLEKNKQVRDE